MCVRVGGEKGWGWGVDACVESVGAGGRVGVFFFCVCGGKVGMGCIWVGGI